jgi:hypothetical protein
LRLERLPDLPAAFLLATILAAFFSSLERLLLGEEVLAMSTGYDSAEVDRNAADIAAGSVPTENYLAALAATACW